ncbi:uncharacterized protein L201_001516 [Kwoniella dendrophila CBS 6074]|uniref:DEK C-terminal domain-containing protein n=1 Tax=Kwoniella dendrophila CBS 6074 TaxID=1295534 RepID=A0AAX4JMM5_9TREE
MDKTLLPKLRRETLKIVRKASKPGGLVDNGEFTMAVARSRIEKAMGFSQGDLGGEWKKELKVIVQDALDKASDELEETKEAGSSKYPSPSPSPPPSPSPVKKKKNAPTSSSKSKDKKQEQKQRQVQKRKSKDPTSSDEEIGFEEEEEEEEEQIESDEEEKKPPPSPPSASKSKSKVKSNPSSSSSGIKKADSDVESDQEEEKAEEEGVEEEEPQARLDDSDMSSVYDEPPTRSRKSGSGSKISSRRRSKSGSADLSCDDEPSRKRTKSAPKKKKNPNEGLSRDEAKVADLKRIVTACGVRKQWAKEFADCPTTSSQIRHLQNLLSSLGMKGNPTLGKAKSLKEKRELAQELDDVQTFEAARGVSSNSGQRTTRAVAGKNKKRSLTDPEEDDSDVSEGADDVELDKEESALGAVLDFLGGDSDSE